MKSIAETKSPGKGGSLAVHSSYLMLAETRKKKMTPTLVPGKNDKKIGRMGPSRLLIFYIV